MPHKFEPLGQAGVPSPRAHHDQREQQAQHHVGGRASGGSRGGRDRRRVAQRVAVPSDAQSAATEAAIIRALPSVMAIVLRGALSWTGYMVRFYPDKSHLNGDYKAKPR